MIPSRTIRSAVVVAILSTTAFGCKTTQVKDTQEISTGSNVVENERKPSSTPISVTRSLIMELYDGSIGATNHALKLANRKFATQLQKPLTSDNLLDVLSENPKLDIEIYNYLKKVPEYASLLKGTEEAEGLRAQADYLIASIKASERIGGVKLKGSAGAQLNPHAQRPSTAANPTRLASIENFKNPINGWLSNMDFEKAWLFCLRNRDHVTVNEVDGTRWVLDSWVRHPMASIDFDIPKELTFALEPKANVTDHRMQGREIQELTYTPVLTQFTYTDGEKSKRLHTTLNRQSIQGEIAPQETARVYFEVVLPNNRQYIRSVPETKAVDGWDDDGYDHLTLEGSLMKGRPNLMVVRAGRSQEILAVYRLVK